MTTSFGRILDDLSAGRHLIGADGDEINDLPIALVPLLSRPKARRPSRECVEPKAPKEESHYIDVHLEDENGDAAAFVKCEIMLACGERLTRRSNEFGVVHIPGFAKSSAFQIRLAR